MNIIGKGYAVHIIFFPTFIPTMIRMRYIPAVVFSFFLLSSCKDTFEDTSLNGNGGNLYRYFPLASGSYIIYDVDSIVHEFADDNTSTPDSLISYYHYQVMEQVDSSFIDAEGERAWRVSRYKRTHDTVPWVFINVWPAKIATGSGVSAQRVEDNYRFVKMAFPVAVNRKWNGNAFNILPPEDYSYDEINEPVSVNGFSFDSCVTVVQHDEVNKIYQVLKKEKYVYGLGMVSKQRDSLNLIDLNFQTFITNGIEYRMVLNDYFPR